MTHRNRIRLYLASYPDGLTAAQLAAITGLKPSTVRARLAELASEGRAVASGRLQMAGNHRPATVWVSSGHAARQRENAREVMARLAQALNDAQPTPAPRRSALCRLQSWFLRILAPFRPARKSR